MADVAPASPFPLPAPLRALRAIAPLRLLVSGATVLALAAVGSPLAPLPAGLRVPVWLPTLAAALLACLTLGSWGLVRSRAAARRAARLTHLVAFSDALGMGALVLLFGAPSLAFVSLLTLVPLAARHAGTTRRVLAWHTLVFLAASEAHVHVQPLEAPSLLEVWLGAAGLLVVTALVLWQTHAHDIGARQLRDRIASRDALGEDAVGDSTTGNSIIGNNAGGGATPTVGAAWTQSLPDALRPLAEAVDAWRWADRERARLTQERDRERAALVARVQAEVLVLQERSRDAARDADVMHEALAQTARALAEGARTARAARAAGEQAAGSVEVAAEAARQLAQGTHGARERLERALRLLRELADAVPRLTTDARGLTPATDAVGALVLTLERVARQTTQVALNASIEAQRAGPFGIGFSVVADEMQRLAAESALAASAVATAVATARDRVHDLTQRLERASVESEHVPDVLAQAHDALDTLRLDVARVVERTDAGMRLTRTQADGAATALMAADGLDERAHHAVLEARRTAQMLSAHATDLHALQQAMQQIEVAPPIAERPARVTGTTRVTRTPRAVSGSAATGAPVADRDVA